MQTLLEDMIMRMWTTHDGITQSFKVKAKVMIYAYEGTVSANKMLEAWIDQIKTYLPECYRTIQSKDRTSQKIK